MSEQLENQEVEQKQEQPADNPIESKARDQGWKPKEEWVADGGDPVKWRDAQTFVDRGELFEKIKDLKNELNNKDRYYQQTIHQIKQHFDRVRETDFKAALAQARSELKQAMVDEDHDRAVELQEKIADLKAEEKVAKVMPQQDAQPQQAQVNAVYQDWVKDNQWYEKDDELHAAADGIAFAMYKKNPNVELPKLYEEVSKTIRKTFPEKFQNPRRQQPSGVEAPTAKPARATVDNFELTEDEKKVMNMLVRGKHMTKEQYIADLKKIKGIE